MVFPQSVFQLSQPSHPALPLQSHVRRILQCKVPIKHQQANLAETLFSHGCSGNDCTTCRDRLCCVWVARASMVIRAASPCMSWTLLEAYLLSIFPKRAVKKTVHKKYCCDRQESCTLYHMYWAFWLSILWAESPHQQLCTPGCLKPGMCFPVGKHNIYIYVSLRGLRPELCLHEEGVRSSSSAALRHGVYGRQRKA